MVESVYIHIPFCKSKCHYCSFISFNKPELKESYLSALEKEIEYFYKKEKLNTLYIGGGTPSTLEIKEIEKILSFFKFKDDAEITIELNPETLTYYYLKNLKDTGINRISIGCQTFDDKILKKINRRHNSSQVIDTVKNAQEAGFENISLDFIYGLPDQSTQMFINDLNKAVNLGIKHISLYGLAIEKGCYFYNNPPKNIADEDAQAQMYLDAVHFLNTHNFEHYEISNFGLKGYFSKHNLNYWNNNEYYGFGTAAHGYMDKIRYSNPETIEEYIKNPILHKQQKLLTQQEILEEEIFLGLRKMTGINIRSINKKFDINFDKKYLNIISKYLPLGLLAKTDEGYRLTPEGFLVSNTILSEFLD